MDKLKFNRIFSIDKNNEVIDPYASVTWVKRVAQIQDSSGQIIFEQNGVEFPDFWTQTAVNVVASKYFYGKLGTPERENSVKQLISRVVNTITEFGVKHNYFDKDNAKIFADELTWMLIHQYGAFNSPVWFNCGLHHAYGAGTKNQTAAGWHWSFDENTAVRCTNTYEYPQTSACFIQSVEDNMDSIMQLAVNEANLFKFGSGTGTDLSTIRSKREYLTGGGRPSGPLSFLKIYDTIAGIVKSGGVTRRAAKMNILRDWHPDILEFINAKAEEEKKAWALIEQGYSGDFNGEAYGSVFFQNENLSVRVSDEFLSAVQADKLWHTHWVTDPTKLGPTYRAKELFAAMAKNAWLCGDPGIQYDSTIQAWHTCPKSGKINCSNPCSEYMFLDDTACNLASLNLLKFLSENNTFDCKKFVHAVEIFITAQDILVDLSSYPTFKIAVNSHNFRPLGLGYANLGALIMAQGFGYDSDAARSLAAAITALMHFAAYKQSAILAKHLGPFAGYELNREDMLRVIDKHIAALDKIPAITNYPLFSMIYAAAKNEVAAIQQLKPFGFRNSQVTVLAPTGTIGFMMDCDTTGIEPDIALVKYKLLAGGGLLKIVNRAVGVALKNLGYTEAQIKNILKYIDDHDTIEGAPDLKPEHLSVFDCAFRPRNGTRSISPEGHVKMMAAVQPFLSGAISKTVNMPANSTPEDIENIYMLGYKLGLKAIAVYRDGSKRSQPLSTSKSKDNELKENKSKDDSKPEEKIKRTSRRKKLPETRKSITHKFEISNHEGYLTVGLYDDGTPGELFIHMSKEGSTISGLMDALGIAISVGLQHGVPLSTLINKFRYTKFEPSGFCTNKEIKLCTSVVDYIAHWLELTFMPLEKPLEEKSDAKPPPPKDVNHLNQFDHMMLDAPICDLCGSVTVRNGSCFRCMNCGISLGCS